MWESVVCTDSFPGWIPIQEANCVVAVAGMEGALASVMGGLVKRPVIAVPTSVGYGASFHGIVSASDNDQFLCQRNCSSKY